MCHNGVFWLITTHCHTVGVAEEAIEALEVLSGLSASNLLLPGRVEVETVLGILCGVGEVRHDATELTEALEGAYGERCDTAAAQMTGAHTVLHHIVTDGDPVHIG